MESPVDLTKDTFTKKEVAKLLKYQTVLCAKYLWNESDRLGDVYYLNKGGNWISGNERCLPDEFRSILENTH